MLELWQASTTTRAKALDARLPRIGPSLPIPAAFLLRLLLPPLLLHLDTQLRQRTCAATFLPSFDKHAHNFTPYFLQATATETSPSSLRVSCHKARLSATHHIITVAASLDPLTLLRPISVADSAS